MPRERRRGLLLFEYPIRAKSLWILNKATLKDVPSLTQTLLLTRPSGSLRSCVKPCRPTWPSESSVVPDKIAGPGTERGLGAHRGAASPAQTGTGGQGPPVVWPRVMFPRVSRPPNHENRPTGLRPAVPGGTVRKSGPPHGPRMAKGRVRRPASEARAGLPVSRARRVSRTRRSSTQTRVAKPCRL